MPSRSRSGLAVLAGAVCLAIGFATGRGFAHRAAPFVEAETHGASERVPLLPSFADTVARTSPGVVAVRSISAVRPSLAGTASEFVEPVEEGASASPQLAVRDGSGFVVSKEGLVVTARHLAVRALRLVVDVPNHGSSSASLVGEDEVTDLAVLRLDQVPDGLVPLELGPSEDLRAGDWIVTVGNPFGLRQSVSAGIVSYVGRHIATDDLRPSSEFLQFSAPVNPGSSGCPVVDLEGRVVGVTTQAARASENLSFAIPSRTLKWALEAMDRSPDGRVHRGRMGVALQPRPGKDGKGNPLPGVLVGRVLAGEPAASAGLATDDVVLAVDGKDVVDTNDLHERITRSAPGNVLTLRVLRDGKEIPAIAVRLADATSPAPKEDLAR